MLVASENSSSTPPARCFSGYKAGGKAARCRLSSGVSLGTELERLQLATIDASIARMLLEARADIMSVTRARQLAVKESLDADMEEVKAEGRVKGTKNIYSVVTGQKSCPSCPSCPEDRPSCRWKGCPW